MISTLSERPIHHSLLRFLLAHKADPDRGEELVRDRD